LKTWCEAAKLNASDIHLQPTQGDQVQVRLRIDGELLTRKLYTSKIHEAICRVIIENNCGLTLELNAAQDGKFDFAVSAHKKINLRVSTLPVTKGSESTPRSWFVYWATTRVWPTWTDWACQPKTRRCSDDWVRPPMD
jgi:type II secretory ATPase GspE/PulE/Tfp pilus assembly ATPase PilB-like protein